jgi:hypothetical protein
VFGLGTKKEQTDEESMIKFQSGDAEAFDLILRRHSPGVLRFIMKMIKVTNSQAEDLLQEVFLRVIEHRKKYDAKMNLLLDLKLNRRMNRLQNNPLKLKRNL